MLLMVRRLSLSMSHCGRRWARHLLGGQRGRVARLGREARHLRRLDVLAWVPTSAMAMPHAAAPRRLGPAPAALVEASQVALHRGNEGCTSHASPCCALNWYSPVIVRGCSSTVPGSSSTRKTRGHLRRSSGTGCRSCIRPSTCDSSNRSGPAGPYRLGRCLAGRKRQRSVSRSHRPRNHHRRCNCPRQRTDLRSALGR